MHRVNTPTERYVEGDKSQGIEGTHMHATEPNTWQEELCYIVEQAGLTLDPNDDTQVFAGMMRRPLGALEYPTIDTSDNKIAATVAAATAGGTVSVPADTVLTLGHGLADGDTGCLRMFTTVALISEDLDVSSTYYLRGQIDSNGDLEIYVQKGTDSDSIPTGLKGTPDGGSGGGFDSTVLDILIAKVETGLAGTVPTLTKLANKAILNATFDFEYDTDRALVWTDWPNSTIVLNWARTPQHSICALTGLRADHNGMLYGDVDATGGSHQLIAVREDNLTRSGGNLEFLYDDSTNTNGEGTATWFLTA